MTEALLRDEYLPQRPDEELEAVAATGEGRRWVWGELSEAEVGGYALDETYRLAPAGSVVWQPPSEVLPVAAAGAWSADDRRLYCATSIDLTMRGGTTSGVVYPLAVCEIATTRRIRNVGGASAGAIAAAATAAAELGRSYPPPGPRDPGPAEEDSATGRVRAGFAGLADLIGWLCQVGPQYRPHQRDEFRLAQLFRPARPQRRLFALATAVMRKHLWAVPLIALMAFGPWSKLVLALVVAGAVVLTASLGDRIGSWPPLDRDAGAAGWTDPQSLVWASADLALFFVFVAGVLVLLPLVRAPRIAVDQPPPWLASLSRVSSASVQADPPRSRLSRAISALALFAAPVILAVFGLWQWTAGALVGAGLAAAITVVVAVSVFRFQARARDVGFGMVAGAEPPSSRRSLPERLAGTPRCTVGPALMPWLGGALTQLAGLPDGQVLRFGHLWLGPRFEPAPWSPLAPAEPDPAWPAAYREWQERTADLRALSHDVRRRSVNLELITTDLTRKRPYSFPLEPTDPNDPDSEQLYVCLDDLAADGNAYFDADVITALTDPEPRSYRTTDGRDVLLHRLPDPWNLPVAFAVRLSVSLPGLFKAVRLYRLMSAAQVCDDFGRPIRRKGDPETLWWWPDRRTRAEELWFSDGGITSNFPVHLFDALLPNWPTFGLNLGGFPDGHPHQDVWLPQDWQAPRAPSSEVAPAATSFVSALVDTARSWRDTMQTGMPGYRGRVAWVRQRPNEGGTNLYMPREVIASLALRGALAGARLRRRFDDDTQGGRYRWLRLRIALANLQRIREDVADGRATYGHILAGADGDLTTLENTYAFDPYSDGADWYRPVDESFWTGAAGLFDDLAARAVPAVNGGRTGDGVIVDGSPRPHPRLGQIPPM